MDTFSPEDEMLVRASDLHKHFKTVHAVNGVNLQVPRGEIFGLVGADGAGKTTTLRLLVGALRMDAGQVFICGRDLRLQPEQARAHIGYLSQRFSLYEDLTVLENIRFFSEVRGLKAGEWYPRCQELLEFVGLAEFKDRKAGHLSGGMRQKLGLAASLSASPRVLLLDEPTTGVDPVTRQDFWQLIIRLISAPQKECPVCVVISTPYMDEAARCSRVGFMRKGKLIKEGTPGELRALLSGRILEVRAAPLQRASQITAALAEVEDVRLFGDRLHMRLREEPHPGFIPRLRQLIEEGGAAFTDARPVPAGLEDVFMALAQQEE